MQKFTITNKAQVYSDDLKEIDGMFKDVGEVISGEVTTIDGQEIILLEVNGFIAAKNAEQKSVEEIIEEKSKEPINKNRKLIYGIVGAGVGYFVSKTLSLNGRLTGIMMVGGFGVGLVAAIKKEQKNKIKKITK